MDASAVTTQTKLGLALSGGGHRAAFFHIGVLAGLARFGLLRQIEVISTVSGGSIVGALYYLHVKKLLETTPDGEITNLDYVRIVKEVEREYLNAAATNVRGSAWASLVANFKMARPNYSRSDRIGELYERRFYRPVWEGDLRRGRIAMRDLLIHPPEHPNGFDPDVGNARRNAKVPVLLIEATTLNTGHNWRFEAMYLGESMPSKSAGDIDKNVYLTRTGWDSSDLSDACRDFSLGAAVVSSACFPFLCAPMKIPGLFEGKVVELVDGGVHDNQGVEGLESRGCTHMIVSDASGQMPDVSRPSLRLPALLGRILSIYSDAEREQRLARIATDPRCVFMHMQTGLSPSTQAPGGERKKQKPKLESSDFGVAGEVQRALANIRTDLDAFCEIEARALMADGYQIAEAMIPKREAVKRLGEPVALDGWAFESVSGRLAEPDKEFRKILQVGKQRFLKPARMVPGLIGLINTIGVLVLLAAVAGLGLLLAPHGWVLFGVGVGVAAIAGCYLGSGNRLVKPVATAIFDVIVLFVLALPLFLASGLQLATGRLWCRRGRERAPARALVP